MLSINKFSINSDLEELAKRLNKLKESEGLELIPDEFHSIVLKCDMPYFEGVWEKTRVIIEKESGRYIINLRRMYGRGEIKIKEGVGGKWHVYKSSVRLALQSSADHLISIDYTNRKDQY